MLQVIAEEIGLGGSPSPTVRGYMLMNVLSQDVSDETAVRCRALG